MKNDTNKFFRLLLIIIFVFINYYFGVFVSNIIDNFFSPCDFQNDDKLIITYILLEYIIAISIYLLIQRFFYDKYKVFIFKTIDIGYFDENFFKSVFTIAFSYGLFQSLNALNEHSRYIYHKHISNFISGKKIVTDEENNS